MIIDRVTSRSLINTWLVATMGLYVFPDPEPQETRTQVPATMGRPWQSEGSILIAGLCSCLERGLYLLRLFCSLELELIFVCSLIPRPHPRRRGLGMRHLFVVCSICNAPYMGPINQSLFGALDY